MGKLCIRYLRPPPPSDFHTPLSFLYAISGLKPKALACHLFRNKGLQSAGEGERGSVWRGRRGVLTSAHPSRLGGHAYLLQAMDDDVGGHCGCQGLEARMDCNVIYPINGIKYLI